MQDHIKSPALSPKLIYGDFYGIFIGQSIITLIIHYIYDIMLIRPDEQETATTPDLLVADMQARGRERISRKFRNLSHQWDF